MSEELKQLTELSRELLEGCKKTASDGTVLYPGRRGEITMPSG